MVLNRSVLLVEGKSADLAKFAIHSIPKQRILITFTKSQPRNSITGSNWAPPPSRSPPNLHNRQQTGPPKHYPVIPTTGVFPQNGAVQPIFISPSPPLPPQMPFPGGVLPGATVWPHPRHQQPPHPRLPVPGTGVFLPPGSAQEQVSTEKSNGSNAAEGKLEMKTKEEACSRDAAEEGGDSKQSN